MTEHGWVVAGLVAIIGVATINAQSPSRDPSAAAISTGTATISGAVVTADPARGAIRRATLTLTRVNSADVRLADTDESGQYAFRDLPAGTYLLSAAKGGYVAANYGEPRPGVAPTPIPLAAGQQFVARAIALTRGAVIAGRLMTATGEPVRFTYLEATQFYLLNGERRRRSAPGTIGAAMTNAHGDFRIYGLSAGDYILMTGSFGSNISLEARATTSQELAWAEERRQGRGGAVPPPQAPSFMWAPAFFPGTTDEGRAAAISLKPGEERTNLDFVVPQLRAGAVTGVVTGPDDAPVADATVGRVPKQQSYLSPSLNGTVRTGADGRFAMTNVGPGDYTITARSWPTGGAAGVSMWAQVDVTVGSSDISNLALPLRPGAVVTGRVQFDGVSAGQEPGRVAVRVVSYVTSGQSLSVGTTYGGRDGTFSMQGLGPGSYRIAVSYSSVTAESPWVAVSAMTGGVNLLDSAIEVLPGQNIAPVVVTLSDRKTGLTGVLTNDSGQPVPLFVLMFPVDRNNWFFGSRWIRFARAGVDGSFELSALPPGEYYLCALTELEVAQQSEASFLDEAIPGAVKITLGDGESKRQDLRIGGRRE